MNDERMPPDALYMLQSIRVFGHFEKPVFLKLCKHTEILNLPAGSFLFKIGMYFSYCQYFFKFSWRVLSISCIATMYLQCKMQKLFEFICKVLLLIASLYARDIYDVINYFE